MFKSQYFTADLKSVFFNRPEVSILQQIPSQYFTTDPKSVFFNRPQHVKLKCEAYVQYGVRVK
jgi:hypothetical protein